MTISTSNVLSLYLLGSVVTSITFLSDLRYASIVAIIGVLIIGLERITVTGKFGYNLGGSMVVAGVVIANLLNFGVRELFYTIFIPLNFLILPLFSRHPISRRALFVVFALAVLLCLPRVQSGGRFTSMIIDSNTNGYASVVFCSTYFGMLLFNRSWVPQLLVFLVSVVLIYFSASRGHLGAILFLGVVYYGMRVTRVQLRMVLVVGVLSMGYLYYGLITDDRFKLLETVEENTQSDKKNRGLSHRDELFNISWSIAKDNPFGVGIGNAESRIEKIWGLELSPHNMYMRMLVEGGWLLLIGYLICLFYMLLTSNSPLASAMFVAVCLRGLFESSMPFNLSLISMMMVLPYFLNEKTIRYGRTSRQLNL